MDRLVVRALVLFVMTVLTPVAKAQVSAHPDISDPRFLEATLRQQWAAIGEDLELRQIDQAALGEAAKWKSGDGAPPPVSGKDGRVVFPFGAVMPRIVCAVQEICDIELQPGETVNDVKQGSQQFLLEPAVAGNTTHVIVRPLVGNIKTHVAIYTDRRVYHLELAAAKDDASMTFVSFRYPEDQRMAWFAAAGARGGAGGQGAPGPAAKTAKAAGEFEISANPGSLYFAYSVEKEGRRRARKRIDWEPIRVYDDGQKTVIEMPRSIMAREMPILLVRDGGKDTVVNLRVKGQHFIVDRIFKTAVLVKGVGRSQERVAIVREGKE
jgi:P-type conjugative transfer protein TrbG